LSEHTDNPELEDEQMATRVIETDAREEDEERWIDSESEGDGWDDDAEDAIPPRPRGRLLRPVPLALIAIVIAAAGFLGGIEAQKGSEGGSGVAAGPGAGFAALAAKAGGSTEAGTEAGGEVASAEGSKAGATAGAPSFGGASSAAASGTVTSVEGNTIYVKETDGTVVAVKAGDGVTVTRDSNVAAKKIHPGDTVTVEGSKKGSTVTASSIAATESGVESTGGFGAPGAATAAGESGGSESEASVESLFEE
jgi:hypothetical protein